MRTSRWRTLAVVFAAAVAVACGSKSTSTGGTVKVQTRNVYLGGPVEVVLGATSLDQIPAAVDQVWQIVQATNFNERAKALASEIASTTPDVVGLQEVALWRTQTPADGTATPATNVAYDFLQILLAELQSAHGLTYSAVATSNNIDIEMTGTTNTDYRLTDRDVILARSGVSTSNPQNGHYTTMLPVTIGGTGGTKIQIPRGWTSVDVTAGGKKFRFVNTHLEAFEGAVNGAQALELGNLVASDASAVLVGDFNSGPSDPTYPAYAVLVAPAYGYADAWTEAGSGPGLTCCFDPTLMDASVSLQRRVDLVLHKGAISATSATVLGAAATDRQGNLWPSDHAGVAATLSVK